MWGILDSDSVPFMPLDGMVPSHMAANGQKAQKHIMGCQEEYIGGGPPFNG